MTGVLLSVLKTEKEMPVFKKDLELVYSNYRPISLLSNIEKILENLCINDCLTFSITIILSITYGLDSDNNILHALINITENIRKALDDGNIGCGVFADIQKTFDTEDHQIRLVKMNHYGIRGVSNDWFKYYLSHCNHHVSINGYDSGLVAISCGVPQGCVLGPLLFLLNINKSI